MSACRTYYASQVTFLEMLLECSEYIEQCRHDHTASKFDVLDSMENRLSMLTGKVVSQPTSSDFTVYPGDYSASKGGA